MHKMYCLWEIQCKGLVMANLRMSFYIVINLSKIINKTKQKQQKILYKNKTCWQQQDFYSIHHLGQALNCQFKKIRYDYINFQL